MNRQEHPQPSENYRPPTRSLRRRIRVAKEESVFLYNILESHEGIVAYSTLPHRAGDLHRDLELYIPPDFEAETDALLRNLGELVYEIPACH